MKNGKRPFLMRRSSWRAGLCIALRKCAKCTVLRCLCAYCAKQNSAKLFEIAQKARKTSEFLQNLFADFASSVQNKRKFCAVSRNMS